MSISPTMMAETRKSTDFVLKRGLILTAVPVSAAIGVGLSFWKIYVFHLVVGIMVCVFVADALRRGRIRPLAQSRLHLMLYGLLGWCLLSSFWSIKLEYTVAYVVYLALGVVVVLSTIACTDSVDRFRRLVLLLTLVFAVEIAIVVGEVLLGVHWPTSTLSPYSIYLGKESGDPKFIFSGFGRNPNNVAVSLLLMIPLALYCLRGYWRYVFSGLAIIVILISGSRASLIGLLMMMMATLAIARGAKFVLASSVAVVCAAWIAGHGLLSLPVPALIDNLGDATLRYLAPDGEGGARDSIAVRRTLISQGFAALSDTRGFGLGAGGSMAIPEYFGAEPGTKAAMHNFWLELLVDTGVPFFICFATWYLYLIFRLWRIARMASNRSIRRIAAGTFVAVTGFSFGVISVSSAIYFLPMWILFGLVLSVVELQRIHSRSANPGILRIRVEQK